MANCACAVGVKFGAPCAMLPNMLAAVPDCAPTPEKLAVAEKAAWLEAVLKGAALSINASPLRTSLFSTRLVLVAASRISSPNPLKFATMPL